MDRGNMLSRIALIVGGLCLVAGLSIGAWLAWQVWVEAPAIANAQAEAGITQEHQWQITPLATPGSGTLPTNIPVAATATRNAAPIAVIRIPRFGKHWVRVIRQGVGEDVLNSFTAGVGHYPGTSMPGAVGNFAIAAHDTGYGNAFLQVPDLRRGDLIYIETKQGTYTYRFERLRTVSQYNLSVLDAVPGKPRATPTQRLITLTTCWPPYNAQVRLAATGILIQFK